MSLAGRLLYHVWHRPRAWRAQIGREGGLRNDLATRSGRAAMRRAALHLPSPVPAEGPPLTLHLLTGARYWDQSAFCLFSLAAQARRPLRPVIHDDGTLAPRHRAALGRLFPHAHFDSLPAQQARLETHLPASRFPTLRRRWSDYPHIRKIIAPHLGASGWKLVLDSDLLFFRRPDFLLDWLDRPDRPLHAVDCTESYGYPRPLLATLAGRPLHPLVNAGLTGLHGDQIDWLDLEHCATTLVARHGTSYLLEQCLVALLVARHDCAVAPAADYVTNPAPTEAEACRAVMHHYVAESKAWYYRANWRRFSDPAPAIR
jgi:hypothetical protein